MRWSELYNEVWWRIQTEADRIVKEECMPQWNELSEKMKPLSPERDALDKEKAADKDNFPEEKQKRLDELNAELSKLAQEYQAVTDKANERLAKFKDEEIEKAEGWCFFLEDDEYDFVAKFVWR